MFGFFNKETQKHKISEMLLKYAGDYLSLGKDIEHKQQLLNSAVSAWNMACLSEHLRQSAMRKYMNEYKKLNPGFTREMIRDAENDIKLLIDDKIRFFPDVNKQIIDARIFEKNGKIQVIAASLNKGKK